MSEKEYLPGEVEFLPLFKGKAGEMLSRNYLAKYGVEEWMIEAHVKRGEIIICGPGAFGSIMLTEEGARVYKGNK